MPALFITMHGVLQMDLLLKERVRPVNVMKILWMVK
jgi:hypothetical protein